VAASLNIMSIPTLAVYQSGKLVETATGAMPASQLSQFIERFI